ncbi:MFS transporter [Lentilactobacillus curieae]|uniref:MFS transporter n=1 Tax=Lentilactobacillus curieae TaxID=1138822 RepID=A0A1S6QIT1_9LACO|nr:MFS transporter [Lentilactobacillus curieae]AQW21516.1 MFS transporter [Lentilactobacillus curieae]
MKSFNFRFFILVLISFTLGCGEFLVSGILNDLSNYFNHSLASVGLLVTVFALVYAISTPIITLLVGRYRYYRTFAVLMVIYILGLIMSATAINYPIMVISRIITASVSGALLSVALTFGNAIAPEEKRGFTIAWIFSGFSIASVVGIPVGTYVAHVASWHAAFWVVAILSLITFGLGLISLPNDLRAGYDDDQDSPLVLLKDPLIWVGVLVPLFWSAGINTFHTYIAPIITDILHFGPVMLSTLLAIIGVISIFSSQASGILANHHGLRKMPFIFIVEILLFLAVGFSYSNVAIALTLIFLMESMFNFLGSSIEIHFLDVAEEFYPQSVVFASSLNPVFFNLGISLGSASGSVIIDGPGLRYINYGSIVFIIVAFGLLTILNRMIAGRGLKE